MKKTLLFGFALACLSLNAQTIYFQDDFNNASLTGNNPWVVFDVVPAVDGNGNNLTWFWQDFNGSQWARVTNFSNSTNYALETWMITPSIDLTGATLPTLSFDNTKRFAGDDMQVLISTDYSGSGDPTIATWTDISASAGLNTDINSWSLTASNDIDLSAYNNQTIYVAYKYIGSSTDGSTYQIDNVMLAEPQVATLKSIYDIQFTTAGNGDSPEDGNLLETGGIVMGLHVDGTGYWIQDSEGAWNGIFVFDGTNTPAVGDSIIVEAEVTEFNSYTQLTNVSSFSIESSGNTSYNPVTVSITDAQTEDYEGVLVRVEEVTCTDDNAGFGNWVVSANGTNLLVGKFIYGYSSQTFNTLYNVQGVMYLAFGEIQILPRNDNDVEVSPFNSIEEDQNTETIVYPNPSMGSVVIENKGQFNYTITDLSGKVLESGSGNDAVTLETEKIGAGIYFIQVEKQNSSEVIRWVKK